MSDNDIDKLLNHLLDTFSTKAACESWLMYPNPLLGMKTPAHVIFIDKKIDRVEAALEALDSGIFI